MESNNKLQITAKDFFLQVGVIAALYVFAVSFLTFLFNIINYSFPDRLAGYGDPYSSTIRFAISTLIVSFPILIYLLKVIYKDLLKNEAKRDLALRRWFIYLTIFFTTLTVAIDLIVLINTFLGGEISTRFILKVVAVGSVALSIFGYSLYDLRGVFFEKPKVRQISLWVLSAIVVASIVWGFFIIGSPNHFRNLRDDSQRVSDLQNIQWELLNKYQTRGTLPNSLSELEDSFTGYVVSTDPNTGEAYGYKGPAALATTTLTFELCANFSEKTQDLAGRGDYANGSSVSYPAKDMYYDPAFGNANWNHEAGTTCFQRTIDPIKYPVNPPTPRPAY
jgi:hypothetical protein